MGAPDARVRRWQEWLNPSWTVFSGGCNLNRDVPGLPTGAGFSLAFTVKRGEVVGSRP